MGASSDGTDDGSKDTTGSGPVVVSGVPATLPCSKVCLNAARKSASGGSAGSAAPKTGHCATTARGRGSQAATATTWPPV